jgi:hypothetical protein
MKNVVMRREKNVTQWSVLDVPLEMLINNSGPDNYKSEVKCREGIEGTFDAVTVYKGT